ncbi:MAG: ComEC/Rec2 family competence protein [Roseibium sp.]|nr:ComEC/Rec2 family competence protein [Roseibium sp.]
MSTKGTQPSTDDDAAPSAPILDSDQENIHGRKSFPWANWIRPVDTTLLGEGLEDQNRRLTSTRDLLSRHHLLWSGFAFCGGIWLYFALPDEPNLLVLLPIFLACSIGALIAWSRARLGPFAILAMASFAGVVCGALRTAHVDGQRFAAPAVATFSGWVLEKRMTDRGPRLLVEVVDMSAPASAIPDGRPRRVRLSVPKRSVVMAGDAVELRARLYPPGGPVRPGGYDFSFTAYFAQIGATGYAYGPPEPASLGSPAARIAFTGWLSGIRTSTAQTIDRLSSRHGETTALAIALLVGDRDRITEPTEEVLREAGLAHVLAISGLHMALFAGGAFSVFVMLLAAIPSVAVAVPVHRIAAVAALLAATVYLGLSGASVATQRSYLMISLVFLGILVGRRGLTLRSVALAGLVLLTLAPERLFHPGFQMSFVAVLCLVAVYQQFRRRQTDRIRKYEQAGLFRRSVRWLGVWIGGLFITALVAGMATGLIGAHHFGRIAPYGLVGNMLGMPVFSLVVMPMGVLTLLSMPFGLAAYPLAVMEAGLSALLDVATFTAAIDTGDGTLVPPGSLTTLLLVAGLFLLLLLPGRGRLLTVAPITAGALLFALARPPDIQIGGSGAAVAARDEMGTLRLSARRAGFEADMWLQMDGVGSKSFPDRKMLPDQRTCDAIGCVVKAYPPGGRNSPVMRGQAVSAAPERTISVRPLILAFPTAGQALIDDCARADIVVTDLEVLVPCRAPFKLSGQERRAVGAVSIWLGTEQDLRSGEVRTVVKDWRKAKTVPPRPWHR